MRIEIQWDTGEREICSSLEDAKEAILNAHSEQSFPDLIRNIDTGVEYGITWSIELEELL